MHKLPCQQLELKQNEAALTGPFFSREMVWLTVKLVLLSFMNKLIWFKTLGKKGALEGHPVFIKKQHRRTQFCLIFFVLEPLSILAI